MVVHRRRPGDHRPFDRDGHCDGSRKQRNPQTAGRRRQQRSILPLQLQDNSFEITTRGLVQAAHLTMLSPGVSGKVDKVHSLFRPGEIILKGTPLVELEKFEYRARLAKAQAELEQARLDVSTEQAEALKAVKKRTVPSPKRPGLRAGPPRARRGAP